jgi:hypothetical protein
MVLIGLPLNGTKTKNKQERQKEVLGKNGLL